MVDIVGTVNNARARKWLAITYYRIGVCTWSHR